MPSAGGRLHEKGENAPTAEALMRSRYSAFVLGLADYLLATWHASTRPAALDLSDEAGTKWLGLDVKRHQQQDAQHAIVEFVARYRAMMPAIPFLTQRGEKCNPTLSSTIPINVRWS